MADLTGNAGIGHTRYPTSGTSLLSEAQPMYLNYPCGIALAHNGNLTNDNEMRELVTQQHRHLNTESDSEVLMNIFAEELRKQLDLRAGERSVKLDEEMVFAAAKVTMGKCRGGYSVVMMIHNVGVVGFRDPWGIRPLCLGSRPSATSARPLHARCTHGHARTAHADANNHRTPLLLRHQRSSASVSPRALNPPGQFRRSGREPSFSATCLMRVANGRLCMRC